MAWAVAVMAAAFAALCGWLVGRRESAGRGQVVDTSGVFGITARTFADVWRGKTLNFQIDSKHALCIPHVTVPKGIQYMERMQSIWIAMGKADGAVAYKLYLEAVSTVWKLCKDTSDRGSRRVFEKRALADHVWFLDICEQITDFWTLVRKKKSLLEAGETLRQTDGYTSTWDSWKLEGGKRAIGPRFAS